MKVHVFVGMFGGLVDRVETYTSEKEAIAAWEAYTANDWEKFKNSNYDNSRLHEKLEGTNIFESEIAGINFDPTRQIMSTWDVDDVKSIRMDLTDEQAMHVLEKVKAGHDASIGINWDVLRCWADDLYPNPDYDEDDYEEEEEV